MTEWLELLELGVFSVQYRYETMEPEEDPLDREAILLKVGALLQKVGQILAGEEG